RTGGDPVGGSGGREIRAAHTSGAGQRGVRCDQRSTGGNPERLHPRRTGCCDCSFRHPCLPAVSWFFTGAGIGEGSGGPSPTQAVTGPGGGNRSSAASGATRLEGSRSVTAGTRGCSS